MLKLIENTTSIRFLFLAASLLLSADIFMLYMKLNKTILEVSLDYIYSNIGLVMTFIVLFSLLVSLVSKIITYLFLFIFSRNNKRKSTSQYYLKPTEILNKSLSTENEQLFQFYKMKYDENRNYFMSISLYNVFSFLCIIDIHTKKSILNTVLNNFLNINMDVFWEGASLLVIASIIYVYPIIVNLIYSEDHGYIYLDNKIFEELK